jgi:tRNA pseudouridine32 synthase/23S rRNA pseudouridine746 synthase
LVETQDGFGRFRLRPRTGKKHQLRVHMASLGFPILGDPLYPDLHEPQAGEPTLQLLASRLRFTDPQTGSPRDFTTRRNLLMSLNFR